MIFKVKIVRWYRTESEPHLGTQREGEVVNMEIDALPPVCGTIISTGVASCDQERCRKLAGVVTELEFSLETGGYIAHIDATQGRIWDPRNNLGYGRPEGRCHDDNLMFDYFVNHPFRVAAKSESLSFIPECVRFCLAIRQPAEAKQSRPPRAFYIS